MKMVDGRMDDRAWLYYKLTNDPKGSGELKMMQNVSPFPGRHFFHNLTYLKETMATMKFISRSKWHISLFAEV